MRRSLHPRGSIRPSPSDRSRGAIAVEFAIAATLLVTLFFGILEVGMLLRSRTVITDASREGARAAAALPRVANFQNNALAAINGVIAANEGEPIDYVVIYRADPSTGLPLSGEAVESCFTDCWRYEWVSGAFEQKLGASWSHLDQYACGGITDTDWFGVYVRGHHGGQLPFLDLSRTFRDTTVMRLEPMELGVPCRP